MTRSLRFFTTAGLAALALSACAPSTLPPTEGSPNAGSPTTGGKLSGTPEPELGHAKTDTDDSSDDTVVYECNSGDDIRVSYPDISTAVINYAGEQLALHNAISADGARYVGKKYEWWTRGNGTNSDGTLYAHNSDNGKGQTLETCHQSQG